MLRCSMHRSEVTTAFRDRSLKNLMALDESGMARLVKRYGWPSYRAEQILRWLYQRRVNSIGGMTDLSLADRKTLAGEFGIWRAQSWTILRSSDHTRKIILTLDDGLNVEAVLIPDQQRLTLCLSTQVGCTLDCSFCLTGMMGLKRNLKPHEILEQVLTAQDLLGPDEQISNAVFMGMGEPLANFEALSESIRRLTNKAWGLGWSPRRITVSTAGMASRLKDVAPLGVNLAVSLNATSDEQRRTLMPTVTDLAPLRTLLAACRHYPLPPHRKLTFEYVLLGGVNDREADAHRLVKLIRGMSCKVNLIAFNPFPGSQFRRPTDDDVLSFQSIVKQSGIDAFVRKSRGRDVLGACGQLGDLPSHDEVETLTQIESRC